MKNVIQSIGQASIIQTECNKRAREIEQKIQSLYKKSYKAKNINLRIRYSNQRTCLEIEQKRLIERGMKVWFSVTSFQGKYINYKNVHLVDSNWYYGTIELIQEAHKLNPAFN